MRRRVFVLAGLVAQAASGLGCEREKQSNRLADSFSCASGDKDACDRHRRELDASCSAGDASACTLLGIVYQAGHIVPKDPARAADLFEKACAKNDASGCWHFGSMLLRGEGRPQDATAARASYEKGCTLGDVNACYDAGSVHEHGRGGPKDLATARARYERACTLSKRPDGLGCSRARELATAK